MPNKTSLSGYPGRFKGDKGEPGVAGAPGSQGAQGSTGATGPAGADGTGTVDFASVQAAGATMDVDTSLLGNGYFIDEDTMVSDDNTKAPSQQSVKAYVDSTVSSSKAYQGGYNAATNTPDLDTSPSSSILSGWQYDVTAAGTFFTIILEIGDTLTSRVDSPTLETDWVVSNTNTTPASTKVSYESNANTNAYPDADVTKVGFITVTKAIDLDKKILRNNDVTTSFSHNGPSYVTLKSYTMTAGQFKDGDEIEVESYLDTTNAGSDRIDYRILVGGIAVATGGTNDGSVSLVSFNVDITRTGATTLVSEYAIDYLDSTGIDNLVGVDKFIAPATGVLDMDANDIVFEIQAKVATTGSAVEVETLQVKHFPLEI